MKSETEKKFTALFGAPPRAVSGTVIISPFFSPRLFMPHLKHQRRFKGLVYYGISGTHKKNRCVFIHTGLGHTPVTDCVFALGACAPAQVIFLGAAGGIAGVNFGDCILVRRAFADTRDYALGGARPLPAESWPCFTPAPSMEQRFERCLRERYPDVKNVNAFSIFSLWHQDEQTAALLKQNDIQAVDLECAYFYAAAKQAGIKALAFCFISDLLPQLPYWRDLSLTERLRINHCLSRLVSLALEF